MNYEVKQIGPDNRADFWRVHCEATGSGWCACVAWWVPTWDGWGDRTVEQNRDLRDALFDRGEFDGYLLYADGVPVGWCQAGRRDRLSKLCRQFDLAPSPDTWAVTCFSVSPSHRGQGVADHLLAAVLADLPQRGAKRVEAFPRSGEALPADDAWTGPERLFRKHGFVPVAPVDGDETGGRLVLERDLGS